MAATKVGRNDRCPCGSGKKFKQCCEGKKPPEMQRSRLGWSLILVAFGVVGGGVLWATKGWGAGLASVGAGLIFAAIAYVLRDPDPPRTSGGDSSAINFGR